MNIMVVVEEHNEETFECTTGLPSQFSYFVENLATYPYEQWWMRCVHILSIQYLLYTLNCMFSLLTYAYKCSTQIQKLKISYQLAMQSV